MKELLFVVGLIALLFFLASWKKAPAAATATTNPFDAGVTSNVFGHQVTVYNHPDVNSGPPIGGIGGGH